MFAGEEVVRFGKVWESGRLLVRAVNRGLEGLT
jgi:hypothetical protein